MKKPSDEMDKIAYAVSFMETSKRLADTEWEDKQNPEHVPASWRPLLRRQLFAHYF